MIDVIEYWFVVTVKMRFAMIRHRRKTLIRNIINIMMWWWCVMCRKYVWRDAKGGKKGRSLASHRRFVRGDNRMVCSRSSANRKGKWNVFFCLSSNFEDVDFTRLLLWFHDSRSSLKVTVTYRTLHNPVPPIILYPPPNFLYFLAYLHFCRIYRVTSTLI